MTTYSLAHKRHTKPRIVSLYSRPGRRGATYDGVTWPPSHPASSHPAGAAGGSKQTVTEAGGWCTARACCVSLPPVSCCSLHTAPSARVHAARHTASTAAQPLYTVRAPAGCMHCTQRAPAKSHAALFSWQTPAESLGLLPARLRADHARFCRLIT